MDFLKDLLKPEVIWILVGIILLILEFALPGLIIAFFGVGAIFVGVICLLFDISPNLQLIIFLVSSILLLFTLRRWLKTIFIGKSKTNASDAADDFIGEKAIVIQKITPNKKGKVEFHGTNWQAESDEEIQKDTTVEIIRKENITLKVKPI